MRRLTQATRDTANMFDTRRWTRSLERAARISWEVSVSLCLGRSMRGPTFSEQPRNDDVSDGRFCVRWRRYESLGMPRCTRFRLHRENSVDRAPPPSFYYVLLRSPTMCGHLSSTGNRGSCFSREDSHQMAQLVYTLSGTMCVWHGILSQESSPTGSRPCTLGRCQQTEPAKTREGAKRSQRESWFVLKIPQSDTNEVGASQVTVTSEPHAQ